MKNLKHDIIGSLAVTILMTCSGALVNFVLGVLLV